MKVLLCFLLVFLMAVSVRSLDIEATHQKKGRFKALREDVDELYDLIDKQQKVIDSLKEHIQNDILDHIKKNGIHLGNRWRIAEEGTGRFEALVFRDLTSTKAGRDRRYAFFQNRYRDY